MRRRNLAILLAVPLLAACGDGQPSPTSAGASASAIPGPSASSGASAELPAATSVAAGAVDSIDELSGAVFQVDQTGTFRYPDGRTRAAGGGSGFIIDPSGLALTNSHVVAAQDAVTVWLGDDRTEHQATVVAVSECSDLALIRLDGGPFPYLGWYDGDIRPGVEIFAAGFPLGDPEFTLAGGIVSRARGVIDETWASVDQKIEHDANTNGGNSGGPIVTHDGAVVAVHYAGNRETRQAFAISRDEALGILPELTAGRDVASLGVNPEAQSVDVEGDPRPGVVIGAVRSGSVADRAGLMPGDVITDIDGVVLGAQHTMREYCDILRDHGSDDVIDVTIWRSDLQAILGAQINGDPIETGFSFLAALAAEVPTGSGGDGFSDRANEPAELVFETPDGWVDEQEKAWSVDGEAVGPGLIAATSVAGFKGGWTTPGAYVAASDRLIGKRTEDDLLDADRRRFEPDCTYVGRESFQRGAWIGRYDLWDACGGSESLFLVIAATTEVSEPQVYVQFQATTSDDLQALDRLFDTLQVSLPG